MDHTYHHEKLNLPAGQQPFHTKNVKDGRKQEKKQEQDRKTSKDQKLVIGNGQGRHTKFEEEHNSEPLQYISRTIEDVPEARHIHQRKLELSPTQAKGKEVAAAEDPEHPVDIRPKEEACVAKELQEAMNTNFFRQWPVKRETDPKIQSSKKVKESTEFRAPLSSEDKARKQQLLEQWTKIEEKDNQPRGIVEVKDKADYEEDQIMDMLMSTGMLKPTLAPYSGTEKKIPTREEVVAAYESTISVYEDAIEDLPTASTSKSNKNSKKLPRTSEQEIPSSKYTRTPRTRRTIITDIDEDEEPAFAPRK